MPYNIVSIQPIDRRIGHKVISYFAKAELSLGQVVQVTISGRKVLVFVEKKETAQDLKAEIKNRPYVLKHINPVPTNVVLSRDITDIARWAALLVAADIGHILDLALPRFNILKALTPRKLSTNTSQDPRYIRLYVAPNAELALQLTRTLESALHQPIQCLHPRLSVKAAVTKIEQIVSSNNPGTVVTTPGFLMLIGQAAREITIAYAGENYRTSENLDLRVYIETYANVSKIPLRYRDSLMPIDRIFKHVPIGERAPIRPSGQITKMQIISTKSAVDGKRTDQALSDETLALLDQTLGAGGSTLIACSRKGSSPLTICRDCGSSVICSDCGSSLVLRSGSSGTYYYCYKCMRSEKSERLCTKCGSWNLRQIGTGTERISILAKKRWPQVSQVTVSRDNFSSMSTAANAINRLPQKPSLIIAIDSFVPYLDTKVDFSVYTGADALLTLPDYTARERLCRRILQIIEKTDRMLVVETNFPESTTLDRVASGRIDEFINSELEERKKYHYPPYSTIIKISLDTSIKDLKETRESIYNKLNKYRPELILPGSGSVGLQKTKILLRLEANNWPDKELGATLVSLRSHKVQVEINPISLL